MSTPHRLTEDLDPSRVIDAPIDLLTYQRDCSVVRPGHATAVVQIGSQEDVIAVMTRAARDAVPVYVRGGGTMYAGGVNPQAGGIVLDMSGLDRILDLDRARGVVVVEPGVRFQSFADEVVGLEVVLPRGDTVRTGSAAAPQAGFFHRYGIGPDLTGLFLGGDASFGVVTKIALWLHRLPAFRKTHCYGFPSVAAAGAFITAVQSEELTRNIWYGSGYEGGSVKARVMAADPTTDPTTLPQFCVGLDFGGEEKLVRHDVQRIADLCAAQRGEWYPRFNEIYFQRLRSTEIYWYGFAGYFSRSRCAILISALPTTNLDAFINAVQHQRNTPPQFVWGGAVVICRRGLHGGIMAFYDEETQWAAAATVIAAESLLAAGCVCPINPAKSGRRRCKRLPRTMRCSRGLKPRSIRRRSCRRAIWDSALNCRCELWPAPTNIDLKLRRTIR